MNATTTSQRPFALDLFTAAEPVDTAAGHSVAYDPDRQISVTSQGTPYAAFADDRSRTSRGMTSRTEVEMMDFH